MNLLENKLFILYWFEKLIFLSEQLIKKSLLRVLRKKLILSSGKLFEIGQNIFFENITDNIATTDWMFLSTIIGINYKHKRSVDAFLKHQNDFNNIALDKSFPNKRSKKAYKKYLKSFLKLMDIGIFDCKWDFRTTWEYKEGE